jgi:hypothetical protein
MRGPTSLAMARTRATTVTAKGLDAGRTNVFAAVWTASPRARQG